MTILQLISSQGFYGAESMSLALARALAAMGHRSIMGLFRDDRGSGAEMAERAAAHQVEVAEIRCRGRWDGAAVRSIRRLLSEHAVDVLHTHGYKADLYGYAAARGRATLAATCHNWPDARLHMQIYAALDRLALSGFDAVATASAPVAGVLESWGIAPQTLKRIPNGVDLEAFRSAEAGDGRAVGSARAIGFVGRLVRDKGGAELLHAAKMILAEFPETRFVFVGAGPQQAEWETLAGDLNITPAVTFAGRRTDMAAVYASLDIVVLPSLKEAMPMCLLEAMAAGKPAVASNVGAVPELISPGETGLLVEPGDIGQLSQAIKDLLRDPVLARRMGEQGRARAAQRYSSTVIAQQYLDLYREAMQTRTAARWTPAWERSRP